MALIKFSIILLIACSVVHMCNGGILDWFSSRPKWYSKIDKQPLIEAFEPQGLRVSIGDVPGLKIFRFHGSVNKNTAIFEHNIVESTNGRWWYFNDDVVLQIGDKLNYWIYAQVNDEEHLFSRQSFTIRNLVPLHQGHSIRFEKKPTSDNVLFINGTKLCACPDVSLNRNIISNITNEHLISSDEHETTDDDFVHLRKSEYRTLNTALISASIELDMMYKYLYEEMKNNSKLLLVYVNSQNENPLIELHDVFDRKLKLPEFKTDIVKAEYTSCGILFQLTSVVVKKHIVYAARQHMNNTAQKFVEPTESNCLHEHNYHIT